MVYILLALIFYTTSIILGTFASRNTDTNLAAFLTNIMSAVVPFFVVLPLLNVKFFSDSKMGIIFAILNGVSIALFSMAIIKATSINRVALVSPIVFGGAIFLSAILSFFIFHEKIAKFQGIGLFFLAIGFSLIIYSGFVEK